MKNILQIITCSHKFYHLFRSDNLEKFPSNWAVPKWLGAESTVSPVLETPIWKRSVSKWGIFECPVSTSLTFKSWIKCILWQNFCFFLSLIQPVKFITWETVLFKMLCFEIFRFQTRLFKMGFTVASMLGDWKFL